VEEKIREGLATAEVEQLRLKYKENILPQKEKDGVFGVFIAQFNNPLSILLIVVGTLSAYFGEYLDATLIATVTLFNVATGFAQEYSAKKTLSALKKIIHQKAFVIRDGKRQEIETENIVPGDIAVISSGEKIPADGKIISGNNILINEAVLTGEEEAVVKDSKRNSEVFMGTTVVSGEGIIEITKTGTETKVGQIGQSLSEISEEETPLQKRLAKFTRYLIILIAVICTIILATEISRGDNLWESIRISVVLSVAAVPEGLPIAITVIMALGMRKILKRKGLVKQLLSIETLGSTSVICLDKTGTITEGKMKVVKTYFTNSKTALLALTLLNDRKAAIEAAVWNFLKEKDDWQPEEVFNAHKRESVEAFDSTKKYKSVVNTVGGKKMLFVMGAPDILLKRCKFKDNERLKAVKTIEFWGSEGLRLLGIASKETGDLTKKKNLTFRGIIGIEDPVRAEAKEAVQKAAAAGIEVKIVTGDFLLTALSVAQKIGLNVTDQNVMDFEKLDKISDAALAERIDDIKVFARVTPLQKLRIVKVLQQKGEVVAMTGDGVNDAPALKKADIGVVVENGTDVAKEAGDLILLDSNFKTILAACEEGRHILGNIKKVVGYVLSNSFEEIIVVFGAMLIGLPAPLTVAQILWINLICDGPPDIMLGFEPKEKGVMMISPKVIKNEEILSPAMKVLVFLVSAASGLSGLSVFWYYNSVVKDTILARTIVFASFATVSLIYIFAFKNLKKTIIKTENFFENKFLIASVIYGFILVFLAIYLPFFNEVLGTVPLNIKQMGIVFVISLIALSVIEATKVVTGTFLKKFPL
jgi:Ca2+-transporting ATPase